MGILGKSLSEEHRKKISEGVKKNLPSTAFKKGIVPSTAWQPGNIPWNKGIEWIERRGKNNNMWKGGVSRGKHMGTEYNIWRKSIFERDDYTCQECRNRGCYLEAHHIKSWANFPELRYEISNGIVLCLECHKQTDNYKGRARKELILC